MGRRLSQFCKYRTDDMRFRRFVVPTRRLHRPMQNRSRAEFRPLDMDPWRVASKFRGCVLDRHASHYNLSRCLYS